MAWFPWNGSKNWLLPTLRDIVRRWPGEGRYIEPFVGSGAMSQVMREEFPAVPQILGDANPWLMSAYEWQASGLPYEKPEGWADVEKWRGLPDAALPELDVVQRATRFAVCLHTAWGNRWKTLDDGSFNASTAPVNTLWCEPGYLGTKLDAFFGQRWLRPGDHVQHRDWLATVSEAKPGDLVYLDPPYPETLGYGNQTWTIGNLLDIMDWVTAAKGITLVVSNVADIERLFARIGFERTTLNGPSASKTRRNRRELVAHNLGDDPFAEFFCS